MSFIKFISVLATCFLFIDGLREMDWSQLALGQALKQVLELVLQGREIILAFLEESPNFADAAKNATAIEAVVSVAGLTSLVIKKQFFLFEFLAQLIGGLIVLSVFFVLVASHGLGLIHAPTSWCMGMAEQIQTRESLNQGRQDIPSMRQEMIESNCGEAGVAIP